MFLIGRIYETILIFCVR